MRDKLLRWALPMAATLAGAVGCSSEEAATTAADLEPATDDLPADTSSSVDVPAGPDTGLPPADGKYRFTFHRGVPGTLLVPHASSPLFGFRLTLEGDEFDDGASFTAEECTITIRCP